MALRRRVFPAMADISGGGDVFLALGANLGDREAMLERALEGLADAVTLTARSRIYETAPMYVTDQPAFLNMAVRGRTQLAPLPLLRRLKALEQALGRQPGLRNGPRLIDLDILYYGERLLDLPDLSIPHPRLAERAFVLHPLADIAPDWRDPRTGLTVAEMRRRVDAGGQDAVRPVAGTARLLR